MTTGAQLGALAGAAVSFFSVQYAGAHMIFPSIGGVLALLVCKKTSFGPKRFHWAISLAFAHLTWFVVGALLAGSAMPVMGDVAVLGLGIAALWVRPSRPSALVLAVPTVVFLAINLYMLASAKVGTLEHKALFVHSVLRLGLLAALWEGEAELRRDSAVAASPTERESA